MNNSQDVATADSPTQQRLMSLDVLRGMDMFLLVGLGAIFRELPKTWDHPWLQKLAGQCHHPQWHGFTLWDLIFPLFIFIVGVAIPFSLSKRIEREGKGSAYRHVVLRAILLFVLGLVYWGMPGGVHPDWGYYSVLYRIGFSYLFAALIVMNFMPRGQLMWAFGIILGYWLVMKFVPVPGYGAGDFSQEGALSVYIGNWVAENISPSCRHLFSITLIPSVANALLGALVGQWLRSDKAAMKKVAGLLLCGGLFLAFSYAVHPTFPINKKLLSTSFTFLTCGISMLLLGSLYWLVDVCRVRSWSLFFVVVGMNPITIYLGSRYINFTKLAEVFVGMLASPASFFAYALTVAVTVAALKWLLLYFLYRMKVFIKI